ncbi:hypothetical protein HMPREF9137_1977 [Prevotella denticola F0289]|nr:hypothetical protein HMPREF9137_1977 [Prevotella denticola F0289]
MLQFSTSPWGPETGNFFNFIIPFYYIEPFSYYDGLFLFYT